MHSEQRHKTTAEACEGGPVAATSKELAGLCFFEGVPEWALKPLARLAMKRCTLKCVQSGAERDLEGNRTASSYNRHYGRMCTESLSLRLLAGAIK